MGKFWSIFWELMDTRLKKTTTFHPHMDGKTKVVNRILGNISKSLVYENPKKWDQMLAQVEFAYNDSPNRST